MDGGHAAAGRGVCGVCAGLAGAVQAPDRADQEQFIQQVVPELFQELTLPVYLN